MSKAHCCKNCFHNSRGLCLRTPTTDGKPNHKRSLAYVSNGDPGRLYVDPNFCCVQYQQFRFTDDVIGGVAEMTTLDDLNGWPGNRAEEAETSERNGG